MSALPLGIMITGGLGALVLSVVAGVVAFAPETPRLIRQEAAFASAMAFCIACAIGAVATHPAFHLALVLP